MNNGEVIMGLRINTNIASIAAQHALGKTERMTTKAMKELATGSRFSDMATDSAGHAISESLRAQVQGLGAARMNAQNASSFIEVAEGALNEQNNLLIRMRELSIQAASDTNSDTERGYINEEFQQLSSEIDRIAKTTSFGSNTLLDGSTKNYEFQVGLQKGYDHVVSYTSDANTTSTGLNVDGLSVEEKSSARDSLQKIDKALETVGAARAKFGAIQSRLENVENHLSSQIESMTTAYSKMNDTDIPDAVARMQKGLILQQYQTAALVHANMMPQNALKLIA